MYNRGDIIDGKYRVESVCSDEGGMGAILFVAPLKAAYTFPIVLKYCRETGEELLKRFRREVRLLGTLQASPRVVRVVDQNLAHDPPYFVMKYYKHGDLRRIAGDFRTDFAIQETIFNKMIDCLQVLHSQKIYHRDIKPQNFLLDGDDIVVSDLGLSKELESSTGATTSSQFWGTHGYLPPEFQRGEFKHATAPSDIFMLGKTIYSLLTTHDPTYLIRHDAVPEPVLRIIERCCAVDALQRYQSLEELKQSLAAAYDVLLGRADQQGKVQQLLNSIMDRLEQASKYDPVAVGELVAQIALLDPEERIRLLRDIPKRLFNVLKREAVRPHLRPFLVMYKEMVESKEYSWPFAETVAAHMKQIFDGEEVQNADKALALDIGVKAAHYMNRFAAMGICQAMAYSVDRDDLGLEVANVIRDNPRTFIEDLEISQVKVAPIRRALSEVKPSTDEGLL